MLDKLRYQIGSSYARFHFRSVRDPIVRFTEAISQARRPVVFLPEASGEASLIEGVLKFLSQRFHTSKVTLVARNEIIPYLPEYRGFNLLTYGAEELNALFLPRTDLLRKLKKSTFDVALDLNIRFALPSSFLCRASQAPLRIGFVKPFADSFYNFQVQTGPSSNHTQAYSQLLKCLDMF
jgi:ADP-heptose:LPS heptosyltransferase